METSENGGLLLLVSTAKTELLENADVTTYYAIAFGVAVTQRQNECACSAFWRASGHFFVSGYDQKAIITIYYNRESSSFV